MTIWEASVRVTLQDMINAMTEVQKPSRVLEMVGSKLRLKED